MDLEIVGDRDSEIEAVWLCGDNERLLDFVLVVEGN